MKTFSIMMIAAVVAITGNWAKEKDMIDARMIIGGSFLAVMIGAIGLANPKLSRAFAWVILITIVFVYIPSITNALGLDGTGNKSSSIQKRRQRGRVVQT